MNKQIQKQKCTRPIFCFDCLKNKTERCILIYSLRNMNASPTQWKNNSAGSFPSCTTASSLGPSRSGLHGHPVLLYWSPWQCLDRDCPRLPGAYVPQINKTLPNTKTQRFDDLGYKSHVFPPCARQLLLFFPCTKRRDPGPKPTREAEDNEADRKPLPPPALEPEPPRGAVAWQGAWHHVLHRVQKAAGPTSPQPPHIPRPTAQKGWALLAAPAGKSPSPAARGHSPALPAPLALPGRGEAAQSRESRKRSRTPRERRRPGARRPGPQDRGGRGGGGAARSIREAALAARPPRPRPRCQAGQGDVQSGGAGHGGRAHHLPLTAGRGTGRGGGARRVPWVSRTLSSPHPSSSSSPLSSSPPPLQTSSRPLSSAGQ